MTSTCPLHDDLTRLLDGELTENRAHALRTHLAACPACAGALESRYRLLGALAAPVPGHPPPGALEAVMRRLDAAAAPPHRFLRRGQARALGAVAAAVLAVLGGLLVRDWVGGRESEFTARGGTVEWTRKVGVELWALEAIPRRLAPGGALPPGTAIVASYSNLDPAPAYLLAFALDARGEVHWLYPAYLDARQDPEAVRLDGSVRRQALPDSVILENVAPGPLRLVLVVSREPLRASGIEAASPEARTTSALRARWPQARVDELVVLAGSTPNLPMKASP